MHCLNCASSQYTNTYASGRRKEEGPRWPNQEWPDIETYCFMSKQAVNKHIPTIHRTVARKKKWKKREMRAHLPGLKHVTGEGALVWLSEYLSYAIVASELPAQWSTPGTACIADVAGCYHVHLIACCCSFVLVCLFCPTALWLSCPGDGGTIIIGACVKFFSLQPI